ncbi:Thymocyte nuclear protein 1 [Acropora cervicornis]|uniref:Thymocyte nuclear protein 1 n=1 Tax=Acropora cervicornis TaxID=6130 RepID=A0AAD9QLX6_ACRCE|nr:Thymocyte nuclear protein 1 [Acropora cervicornis]
MKGGRYDTESEEKYEEVQYTRWLMKSEPESRFEKGVDVKFGIEDLKREPNQTACWDGVRNYQARNFMRDQMKIGQLAFFYHSNCKDPGIAGIVEVDVKFVRMLNRFISLKELKSLHLEHKASGGPLKSLALFTSARLSVQPVTEVQSIVLKCCVIIRTSRKREAMSIIYSLVSRGTTVLVDYAETTGNFQQITGSILQKIPLHNDTKCTYVSGRLIRQRFVNSSLKQRAITAHAYEFRRDFGQVLSSQMALFSDPFNDETDQISKVRRQVHEVQDVMTQNIEKVLERGEKLDVLIEKAEELDHGSQVFHAQSRRLHRKMWWQNQKMCLILTFVVLVIIAAIVLGILGADRKL